MKIAIISDIHLGDKKCKLLRPIEDSPQKKNSSQMEDAEQYRTTDTFNELCREIKKFTKGQGPLDYLVLNGDILDFSINEFDDTCRIAKPFFRALAESKLAKTIVYIPGNHDKHIWDAVEWERNIIMKLKAFDKPKDFTRVQTGLIDYAKGNLYLPNVTTLGNEGEYGGLFLEGLFDKDNFLRMNVVYPTLFIKNSTDTYLVTHGHMLDMAWVLLSELLGGEPGIAKNPNMHELEEYNIPITSMICTGVGQAGSVSQLFYEIQVQAKKGRTTRLEKTLRNVIPKLDKLVDFPWYARRFGYLLPRLFLKSILRKMATEIKDSRYNEQFLDEDSIKRRFLRFYAASCLRAKEDFGIDPPKKMIFGHTHEPIPIDNPFKIKKSELPDLGVPEVWAYNTGGWLKEGTKGAEVFFFDDDGTLSSVSIK